MQSRTFVLIALSCGALVAPSAAHADLAPAGVVSAPRVVSAHIEAARGSVLALRSAVASGDVARIRRALRRFAGEVRVARRGAIAASAKRVNVRTAALLADLLAAQTTAAGVFADLMDEAPVDLQATLAKALRDVLSGAVPVSEALGRIADRLPESARVAIAAALAELPLADIDQLMSDVLAAAGSSAVVDAATPIFRDVVALLAKLTDEAATSAQAALAELPAGALPAPLLPLLQRTQGVVADAAGLVAGLPALDGITLTPLAEAVDGLLDVFTNSSVATIPAAAAPARVGGVISQILGLLTAARPAAF